jgi:hypothetical protein
MSAKLVPTFADRGCRMVSAADPHGYILDFLGRKIHSLPFHKIPAMKSSPEQFQSNMTL